MPDAPLTPDEVRHLLDEVLASRAFHGSGRAGTLLRFLVDRTLAGRQDELKEYTVATEALGRTSAFDPRTDAIVRVEMSRLRKRLEDYYRSDGRDSRARLVIPKGAYAVQVDAAAPVRDPDRRPGSWRLASVTLTTLGALLAVAGWWGTRTPTFTDRPATRLEVDLGDAVVLRSTQVGSSSVVISPAGDRLVFVAFRDQTPRLMTRALHGADEAVPVEVTGTGGARSPFFSPDGRYVGYLAGGQVWKVRLDGGEPTAICRADELLGASWGDDGAIIAALTTGGLSRVASSGGQPALLAGTPVGARWPQALPGGKAVLFTAGAPAPGPQRVDVYTFADGRTRTLLQGATYVRYVPTGHLVWLAGQTLMAARFDVDRLAITGPGVAVIHDVAVGMYASGEFDVSTTGTLVFRRQPGGRASTLAWLDATGTVAPLLTQSAEYTLPRLAPDGRRLAFSRGETPRPEDLQILDVATGVASRPVTAGIRNFATWSPDGTFLVGSGSAGEIRWMRADRSGLAGTLLTVPGAVPLPWSFDGQGGRLAFHQRGTGPGGAVTFDLWTVPVSVQDGRLSAGTPEPFLVSNAFEFFPTFSPDGRWLAYTSLEEGAYEIYVRRFPDSGRAWRISTHGGIVAAWSRDGRRLLYETLDHRLMTVDVSTAGDQWQPAAPRLWADRTLADTGMGPGFDVAPDGRLVVLVPPPGAPPRQRAGNVTLVLDFVSEMQRRVAAATLPTR